MMRSSSVKKNLWESTDKRRVLVSLFSCLMLAVIAARAQNADLPKFMGRNVTIAAPPLDADGFSRKGGASVCIEGTQDRHCYTAPKDFGKDPRVSVVQIEKDRPALLFSADSGGVSGFAVHFALLRPGIGKDLDELLNVSLPNQNQHVFWDLPEFPEAKIFVTAEFVWGPDEGHYDAHRFIVSAYTLEHPRSIGTVAYYLKDRYMTVRKYSQDANDDILGSEKPEILARLRKVKAEQARGQRSTR